MWSETTIITVLGTALAAGGGAIKYLIDRIDRKSREQEARADAALSELRRNLEERIEQMEREIATLRQREEIAFRRIYQLEATLRANRIEIPTTEGWPPS